jgi:hypothetical protein
MLNFYDHGLGKFLRTLFFQYPFLLRRTVGSKDISAIIKSSSNEKV